MRFSIIKYLSLGLLGLFFACGPQPDKHKPDLGKEVQALMPEIKADSTGKQGFAFEYTALSICRQSR